MLSKYNKQDAPSWQRKLVFVLGSLFSATLLLFIVWAFVLYNDRARIDDCVDKGGSFDHERGVCDSRSNAVAPED